LFDCFSLPSSGPHITSHTGILPSCEALVGLGLDESHARALEKKQVSRPGQALAVQPSNNLCDGAHDDNCTEPVSSAAAHNPVNGHARVVVRYCDGQSTGRESLLQGPPTPVCVTARRNQPLALAGHGTVKIIISLHLCCQGGLSGSVISFCCTLALSKEARTQCAEDELKLMYGSARVLD